MLAIRGQLTQSGIRIEWTNVEKLHDVLKPLERFTKKLQTEQYLPGDLMYDLNHCQTRLRSVARKNPDLRLMVDDMLDRINWRVKLITKNIQFISALYMDPRYVHNSMGVAYIGPNEFIEVVVRIKIS